MSFNDLIRGQTLYHRTHETGSLLPFALFHDIECRNHDELLQAARLILQYKSSNEDLYSVAIKEYPEYFI